MLIEYSNRGPVEAISGQGLVPVIEDAGEVINDSVAILRHLERRTPEPPLFPADPARRAEVDVFIEWFERVYKAAPNAIEDELERRRPGRGADRAARRRDGRAARRVRGPADRRRLPVAGELGAADFVAYPFLKYARRPRPGRRRALPRRSSTSTSRSATLTPTCAPGSSGSPRSRAPTGTDERRDRRAARPRRRARAAGRGAVPADRRRRLGGRRARRAAGLRRGPAAARPPARTRKAAKLYMQETGAGHRRGDRRARRGRQGASRRPSSRAARQRSRGDGQPPRRRDQPLPAPAHGQPGRLVSVGRRGARARASSSTARSCSRSATRPVTGAT